MRLTPSSRSRYSARRLLLCAALLLAAASNGLITLSHAADVQTPAPDTKGVVEVETDGASESSVRIVEDIVSVVDDGATRRVLPVIGKSAQQNLIDLVRLRGIDMAIIPADVLDNARRQNSHPDIIQAISYVAELYSEELHILAGPEIHNVDDLTNQTVNVGRAGSGTATTAGLVFNLLNIHVVFTNYDQSTALDALRQHKIAALALVASKPAALFQHVGHDEGFHFISVPLRPNVIKAYVPTTLNSSDYPSLIDAGQHVDTIAVATVLAIANLPPASDRYRAEENFVNVLFTRFPTLLGPNRDPKWREVSLAAVLPGWHRFAPAQQWLDRNASLASANDLKNMFYNFIEMRQKVVGGPTMTEEQKQQLFDEFERWQKGQAQ